MRKRASKNDAIIPITLTTIGIKRLYCLSDWDSLQPITKNHNHNKQNPAYIISGNFIPKIICMYVMNTIDMMLIQQETAPPVFYLCYIAATMEVEGKTVL